MKMTIGKVILIGVIVLMVTLPTISIINEKFCCETYYTLTEKPRVEDLPGIV